MTPAKLPDDNLTPLSVSFLKKLQSLSIDAVSDALGISKKPKSERLAKLKPEQEDALRKIESVAICEYQGDLTQLEAALGMLRMGHHLGWRVLYIIHSKRTIRSYEEILGIKIREVFPETGPSSYRSFGFNLAMRYSNFWKVVGGEIKIPHRQNVSK